MCSTPAGLTGSPCKAWLADRLATCVIGFVEAFIAHTLRGAGRVGTKGRRVIRTLDARALVVGVQRRVEKACFARDLKAGGAPEPACASLLLVARHRAGRRLHLRR